MKELLPERFLLYPRRIYVRHLTHSRAYASERKSSNCRKRAHNHLHSRGDPKFAKRREIPRFSSKGVNNVEFSKVCATWSKRQLRDLQKVLLLARRHVVQDCRQAECQKTAISPQQRKKGKKNLRQENCYAER